MSALPGLASAIVPKEALHLRPSRPSAPLRRPAWSTSPLLSNPAGLDRLQGTRCACASYSSGTSGSSARTAASRASHASVIADSTSACTAMPSPLQNTHDDSKHPRRPRSVCLAPSMAPAGISPGDGLPLASLRRRRSPPLPRSSIAEATVARASGCQGILRHGHHPSPKPCAAAAIGRVRRS